jgi:hypothetical protein
MNENNKFFYPSNMFEIIHHPEYGCRDLKGLIIVSNKTSIKDGIAALLLKAECIHVFQGIFMVQHGY